MASNFLTRLKKAGQRKEEAFVFEGAEFTVRDITGNMRDYWDQDAKQRVKFKGKHPDLNTLQTEGQRALLVAMTLVDDETKELAFDFKSKDDLTEIGELSGGLLDKAFEKALDLCGLNPQAEKETEGN